MSLPCMNKRQKSVKAGCAWLHGSGSQDQRTLPHGQWPLHVLDWRARQVSRSDKLASDSHSCTTQKASQQAVSCLCRIHSEQVEKVFKLIEHQLASMVQHTIQKKSTKKAADKQLEVSLQQSSSYYAAAEGV